MAIKTTGIGNSADVVIVGGGIIGLAIARELRLRGAVNVMLIERGTLGAEASWAAGGILAPQIEVDRADDFFRLACAGRDMYPAFAATLESETGVDVELDQTGTLCVAFTAENEAELRLRYKWQHAAGLGIELLSGEEARRLEPCLSPDARTALRFPNDIQVENRRLIQALIAANEKAGVRLVSECEVQTLHIDGHKVTGVETSQGFVSTPSVVLAAGAWTPAINTDGSPLPQIPIEPIRGQMLCFKSNPPIARHVIYSSRGYLVPRRDGRLLAGSTAESAGFEKVVTQKGIAAIKSMASEIAPVFGELPLLDSWAGLRPRAKDSLPVLGSCDEIEGVCYATGHYRNGILLAPITGQLIADVIVSGIEPALLTSFSPRRFSRAGSRVMS